MSLFIHVIFLLVIFELTKIWLGWCLTLLILLLFVILYRITMLKTINPTSLWGTYTIILFICNLTTILIIIFKSTIAICTHFALRTINNVYHIRFASVCRTISLVRYWILICGSTFLYWILFGYKTIEITKFIWYLFFWKTLCHIKWFLFQNWWIKIWSFVNHLSIISRHWTLLCLFCQQIACFKLLIDIFILKLLNYLVRNLKSWLVVIKLIDKFRTWFNSLC